MKHIITHGPISTHDLELELGVDPGALEAVLYRALRDSLVYKTGYQRRLWTVGKQMSIFG